MSDNARVFRYDIVISYEDDNGRRTEGTVRVDAVDFGKAEANALRHADAVDLKAAVIRSIKFSSFVGIVPTSDTDSRIDRAVESAMDMLFIIERMATWSYSGMDESTGATDYFMDNVFNPSKALIDYINKGVTK